MNLSQYLEARALSVLGLLPAADPTSEEKMVFVNDFEEIVKQRIETYVTWYSGDSDELLRVYNFNQRVEYRTEYYYYLNDRSYFWAVSAMEKEFKRTHSGFGKAVVDVIVDICGTPLSEVPDLPDGNRVAFGPVLPEADGKTLYATDVLEGILEVNDFWNLYQNVQMPMTLVEGWGAYKIHWNRNAYGPEPVISYYRANNCRVYRRGNRCLGITFLDWMEDGKGNRYLIAETRVWKKYGEEAWFITECFRSFGNADSLIEVRKGDESGLPVEPQTLKGMPMLFAEPCSFYADHLHGYEGQSVLAGKIDILDDLDEALSIASNTLRRATPIETFDIDFCDRDMHTGEPKLPKTFERRYVAVHGKKNASGDSEGSKPVEVTQPQVNTQMFDDHIQQLQRMIVNGLLSPATIGLDIGMKDTNDTIRQKDKTTVHTRNHILAIERRILKSLFSQALCAKEYLAYGRCSKLEWEVEVAFDEFSDTAYENKIQTMSAVLANDGVSPKMYVEKVYGNSLTKEAKAEEANWIEEHHKSPAPEQGEDPFGGMDMGMEGDAPEGE